jgi:hypothetical protein
MSSDRLDKHKSIARFADAFSRRASRNVTIADRGGAREPPFCMAGPDSYQFVWVALERVI